MIHLWDKLKHFIKKAFTIILVSTILIWFLSSFKWDWTMVPEILDPETGEFICYDVSQSILASIGQLIQPLFTPLGFGSQLNAFGWVFAVAAITGLIAKENVIATFGTLATAISLLAGTQGIFVPDEALEGVDSVMQMVSVTNVSWSSLIAFIIFNMTTIPCFAAVATAKAELPEGKFGSTIGFWLVVSYLTGTLAYLVLLPLIKDGVLTGGQKLLLLLLLLVLLVMYIYIITGRKSKQIIKRHNYATY